MDMCELCKIQTTDKRKKESEILCRFCDSLLKNAVDRNGILNMKQTSDFGFCVKCKRIMPLAHNGFWVCTTCLSEYSNSRRIRVHAYRIPSCPTCFLFQFCQNQVSENWLVACEKPSLHDLVRIGIIDIKTLQRLTHATRIKNGSSVRYQQEMRKTYAVLGT